MPHANHHMFQNSGRLVLHVSQDMTQKITKKLIFLIFLDFIHLQSRKKHVVVHIPSIYRNVPLFHLNWGIGSSFWIRPDDSAVWNGPGQPSNTAKFCMHTDSQLGVCLDLQICTDRKQPGKMWGCEVWMWQGMSDPSHGNRDRLSIELSGTAWWQRCQVH